VAVHNLKTEDKKVLKSIRKKLPAYVAEIELAVTGEQEFKIQRIGNQLRIIRNTVLGQLKKNYDQMVRTKAYKSALKEYQQICEALTKTTDAKDTDKLIQQKKITADKLIKLQQKHNVTFEYARNYGKQMRTKFSLPDAVLVLTTCEMVWRSIETLLYKGADKVYFYNKDDLITFQGKQANRCIILKAVAENNFYVKFGNLELPLIVKQNDLYIKETLANISHYIKNNISIDSNNIKLYNQGLDPVSTYRIRNNRIVRRLIRGRIRYYLQITIEGNPVPKRNKDGSIRHKYGTTGRIGVDIGTQSIAVVTDNQVILKNMAERSTNTFKHEHTIHLLQKRLDRSRRATNPDNYNEDGTIKKGPKTWVYSNHYKKARAKIKDLHRKAATNRKLSHNEDINKLRSMGSELIIEPMNIKALQKKTKTVTKNEKTGKYNRRKRFGKSILRRSPGYFIEQAKYRFNCSGGRVQEVNNQTFKASQYDHQLNDTKKKQLSQRWHVFDDKTKVQRDLYSAFLLYCTDETFQEPDHGICTNFFESFLKMHDRCINEIIASGKKVMNSGIKIA